MDKLKKLKEDYDNIQIPEELDFAVKKAIKGGRKLAKKEVKKGKRLTAAAAAAILVFFVSVNVSTTFADALSEVAVLGKLVKVLTIREYIVDEESYDANIKVPEIEGMENKTLQNSLNEKYLKENKKLYEEFNKEIEDLKAAGGGHLGVDSGYEVKTDNDSILSIRRYVVNTVGSSSTTFQYDTIDKQEQVLITLPSLFKDDSYIKIISQNIKEQMQQQMEKDKDKYYWLNDEMIDNFEKIKQDQGFYISNNGKLIISFDKYEVAPGYMGNPEFEIPTELLSEVLVSKEYIK